ncbi:unnamed protein product, partial [Rotaria sordida]
IRRAIAQFNNKHLRQSCEVTLSEKQFNSLIYDVKNDLNELEKQCKADECI